MARKKKYKQIVIRMDQSLYDAITVAAKGDELSREGWLRQLAARNAGVKSRVGWQMNRKTKR